MGLSSSEKEGALSTKVLVLGAGTEHLSQSFDSESLCVYQSSCSKATEPSLQSICRMCRSGDSKAGT